MHLGEDAQSFSATAVAKCLENSTLTLRTDLAYFPRRFPVPSVGWVPVLSTTRPVLRLSRSKVLQSILTARAHDCSAKAFCRDYPCISNF